MQSTQREENKFTWPIILKRKSIFTVNIEPNEKDQLDFEFPLPSNINTIRIYTHIENTKKS